MSAQRWWPWIRIPLAVLCLLNPFVAYLGWYDDGDCDDKAVHFFSAMYSAATADERTAFASTIEPFVQEKQDDPRWSRAAFRLRTVNNYPLANTAIALVHRSDRAYFESVKWGLLGVTALGVLAVLLINVMTPFGLWRTLLLLNLIAFTVVPATWFLVPVHEHMYPFTSYVPRGAGALLVVPAALALAAGRYWLSALSVALVFLWHTGLGLLIVAAFLPVVVLYVIARRFGRLDQARPDGHEFQWRALVIGFFFLLSIMLGSAVAKVPFIQAQLLAINPLVGAQVPERLSGAAYSLLVLCVVLGAGIALARRQRLIGRLAAGGRLLLGTGILVALLWFVFANRFAYKEVASRTTGFFSQPECAQTQILPLPEGLSQFSLVDQAGESSVFASFGDFLFRLRLSRH